MTDIDTIRFDLSLEESDLHYLYARTKLGRDSLQQLRNDETAVRYCLLGIGHIRLREPDLAERRLLCAKQLDQAFADPPLLLAALRSSGEEQKYLAAALAVRPDCLGHSEIHQLLWLLGVPRKKREIVASKEPITGMNLEILVWAIECQDDEERNKAKNLLVAARKRLGF